MYLEVETHGELQQLLGACRLLGIILNAALHLVIHGHGQRLGFLERLLQRSQLPFGHIAITGQRLD